MDEFPFLPALVLLGAFGLVVALLLASQPQPVSQVAVVPTTAATETAPPATEAPTAEPTEEVADAASAETVSYDPAVVSRGQTLYSSVCSACHGMNARGVPGLGKDLLGGEFVHGLDDEALLQFIIAGRQPWDEGNTTGIAMPPRGGNPMITDDELRSIIAYIRTETQNQGLGGSPAVSAAPTTAAQPTAAPTQAPTLAPTTAPAEAAVQPTSAPVTQGPVATLPPPTPRDGETAYAFLCAGCHGPSGEGTANNGPAITDSELLNDDAQLREFLVQVERIQPEQGFVHPVRGGVPELTDEEIQPLIDYLHTLAGE